MDVVVAAICGVVGANALLGFVFFGGVAVLSVLSDDPSSDPHGYGMIFGVILGVPCALVAAITLPAVFPPSARLRAYGVSVAVFVVLMVLGGGIFAVFG